MSCHQVEATYGTVNVYLTCVRDGDAVIIYRYVSSHRHEDFFTINTKKSVY